MSRYTGPRLKIIRRLGTILPGLMRPGKEERRAYPPGQHGPTSRGKHSEYALRLREKQKLRFHYGVSEKQLAKYMEKAARRKGNPGSNLLESLERRLDNVAFRAGYVISIPAARQLVRHGHLLVNGKKVDIPSYSLKAGDLITVNEKSKMKEKIVEIQGTSGNSLPSFLQKVDESVSVKMTMVPHRDDTLVVVNEQLIVEFYSGR